MKFSFLESALLVSALLAAYSVQAQNNDCVDAIPICSDDNISLNPTGPGANDFADPDNFDGCLGGENQSGWYYFEIQADAPPGLELGFTINPDAGAGQDYDFAVFGPNVTCDNLGSPTRCSYAGGGCALCPQTGLGMGATDLSESPGGNGFVRVLTVQPGEGYYLLIDNFSNNSTGFSLTWTGTAAPWLNCVLCDADAGTVTADPNPTCPGTTISFEATDFYDDPAYTQLMLVADENGDFIDIITGSSGTLSSAECAEFTVYSYNYETAGSAVVPVIGGNISDLDCSLDCCDLAELPVSFEDTEDPTFPNAPGDITLTCADLVTPIDDQEWADNCDGNGLVAGVESGSADLCNGGTITRTWEYTDVCGNTGTHLQTITVEPTPEADFVNPPGDVTVACSAAPTGPGPTLMYANNAPGSCEIVGTSDPVQSGSFDECGGSIIYTWNETDFCGRPINHTQTITIEPATEANYVNPPDDLTISCADLPGLSAPDLGYTNGESGTCSISGTVSPIQGGSADECGGNLTFTWDTNDPCGRPINHVQNISVAPVPEAVFLSTPPATRTISCSELATLSAPDLDYSNGESGSCLIEGVIPPVQSGSANECGGTIVFEWDFTDDCGRQLNFQQTVTVLPAPQAAFFDLPPATLTFSCADAPFAPGPDLEYTNNETGSCAIQGFAPAVWSGSLDECGGIMTNTWEFTDACGRPISFVQTITIEPAAEAAFINPPGDMTFSCDNVPSLQALDLDYYNEELGTCAIEGSVSPTQEGFFTECGGTVTFTWEFTDECDRTIMHQQNINVTPGPPPTFVDPPPAAITVTCDNLPDPSGLELAYDNGQTGDCEIFGQVPAEVSGFVGVCGGTLTYFWDYTDPCGRNINHTQVVTVEPGPPPVFLDLPPAEVTVSCSDYVEDPAPDLVYDNGVVNNCGIFGFESPTTFGSVDECGGIITHIWSYTSPCGDAISYTQNITVEPAPDPVFIDLPEEGNVGCGEDFPTPPDLTVSNGEEGSCAINTAVAATVTNISPTEQQYDWVYTIPCSGEEITFTQTVSQEAAPDISLAPSFGNICSGESFDLSTITVTEASGSSPMISYHSASPADSGNELATTVVSPGDTTTYYLLATNAAGCSDEEAFTINVDHLPQAGDDGMGIVCFELSDSISLEAYLSGSPQPDGEWIDPDATGVSLANPVNVNLSGLGPGDYRFQYVVSSSGPCPNDTATVLLEILPPITIEVLDILCTDDLNAYGFTINSNGFDIATSGGGTLSQHSGELYELNDVPIGTSIVITASNPIAAGCVTTVTVSPPDCNCPNVEPPVSNGSLTVCAGATNSTLSVTVADGQTANWFTDPTGGIAFLTGSTTFAPAETTPGTYTYFVESQNLVDDCVSPFRIPVSLEIVANPTGQNASLSLCDNDFDGLTTFDLTASEAQISTDPGLAFRYFPDMAAATDGSAPLASLFTNTTAFAQNLVVELSNADGCISFVTLSLTVNIPPVIDLAVSSEGCLGAEDGMITVNAPGSVRFSLDSTNWISDNSFMDLAPGDYRVYTESSEGCVSSQGFTVDPGIEVLVSSFEAICDNNGTPSDPSDDFYTINYTVGNSQSQAGTFSVNDGSEDWGSFPFDDPQSRVVPANGQSFALMFTDDSRGCSILQPIGPLTTCSSDCLASINSLELTCDNNGTDTNPNDDLYTVTLNASAINGSAAGTYVLLIDDVIVGVHNYGENIQFSLPANGASPIVRIQDTEDTFCTAEQQIGPLFSCSGACTLAESITNFTCNDTGTPTDPADDTFTFNVVITGANVGDRWEVDGTDISAEYGQTVTFGPFLVTDGDQSFTVVDQQNPACPLTFIAPATAPCSDECALNITALETNCNNNGTEAVQADDFYEITIAAAVVNDASADSFQVLTNGMVIDIFAYSDGGTFTLPADGSSPQIEVRNLGIADCSASQVLGVLAPCNGPCEIDVFVNGIICDDAGTNAPSDDTFSAELIVSGENTSTGWSFAGNPETYPYNVPFTVGPFLISNGTSSITVQDSGNANCSVDFSITAPPPCSPTCSISITSIEVSCNDNGTEAVQNDDFYDITVNALAENGGPTNSFEVLVNDNPVGAFPYAAGGSFILPADGSSPIITVRDVTEMACSASQGIGPLAPCTDACMLGANFTNVVCDDAGSGNNTADDTYTFELTVTGQNASGQWQTTDGSLSGSYGQTITVGPILISAGNTSLVIQDQQNPDCQATVLVSVPATCSACTQTVNAGPDATLTCADPETFLQGTSSSPGAYGWWFEGILFANEAGATVSQPGIYRFTATFPDGCSAEDSLRVFDDSNLPLISQIEVVHERCADEENGRIVVEEITGGSPPYSYLFNGQDINSAGFFTQLTPGDYTINITDRNGCMYDTLISIKPGPDLTISDPIFLDVMRGDSGFIEIDVSVPEDELRVIQWTPPEQLSCDTCLSTQIYAGMSQNYVLDVVHENGCAVSTTLQLLAEQDLMVYIPNAFSPDGNGTNDYFTLFAEDRVANIEEMAIFDRWGEQVFFAEGIPPNEPILGWDGMLDGKPMNAAVYVYSFLITLTDGSRLVFKGDVVLMR